MSTTFDLESIQEGAERIVSFTLSEDRKSLNVAEECDCYFKADLTKGQVRELINRLDALHAQMED